MKTMIWQISNSIFYSDMPESGCYQYNCEEDREQFKDVKQHFLALADELRAHDVLVTMLPKHGIDIISQNEEIHAVPMTNESVIIVKYPMSMAGQAMSPRENRANIANSIKEKFPLNKFIMLPENIDFQVI